MGKMALRTVQNASFKFDKVFVADNNRLEKATNFTKSANQVLNGSRVVVAWQIAACAVGAYERALKYCVTRKQFGKPIAAF